MTRKDYVRLARVIAVTKNDGMLYTHLVERMANMLAEDNPKFDRDKFYQACER